MYTKKVIYSILSTAILMKSVSASNFNLDDNADKFFQTQTGSHLHALYPTLKPSEAVKTAINHVVTKHKRHIEKQSQEAGHIYFDYSKKEEEIQKQYDQVLGMMKNEIKYNDSHSFFYHGFSSGMTAYNETLYQMMSIAGLKDLGQAHPLHYKFGDQTKVKDVKSLFSNNKYYKAHLENVDNLKKMAVQDPENYRKYKYVKPFNFKKNLGVGKAPDTSTYSRQHVKSVNLSLFGNSENSGESSYLFYLTSGNIGSFNEGLTVNLLNRAGILSQDSSQEDINQKVNEYKAIYEETMSKAGGGMLQIMMKNKHVDQYGFAAWAKGIPYLMDKNTGRLAVRDGNNDKPVPFLNMENKNFKMPSLLRTIKDFKASPWQFSKKYSGDGKKHFDGIDRFQARLVIDPATFANKRKVKVLSTTSNSVTEAESAEYKKKLHNKILEDLTTAIKNNKFVEEFSKKFEIGKLTNYFFGNNGTISEVIDIFKKSSKNIFNEVLGALKKAAANISDLNESVTEKFNLFDQIKSTYDDLVSKGKKMGRNIFRGLKQLFA